MSDANILNPPPIEWASNGRTYRFGPCDLEVELLFQSVQERWAVNRLETIKGGVSPAAYEAMASRLAEQIASNRFAFGTALSWHFLFSPAGMMEYCALLSRKSKTPVASRTLEAFRRADPKGWEKLWRQIEDRDFPNPPAGDQAPDSEALESPTPSTTASSSSSAVAPG